MSSSRRRREPCAHEDCGSRRFHEGEDGYTYCDQGHQQTERGTVIAEDTGELQTPGKKSRRQDSDAESVTSRVSGLDGSQAFEYYLQCVQYVLIRQVRWLIAVQKLPDELEMIAKDLWALRLRDARSKVPQRAGTDTEISSSQVFSSQSESETGTASRRSRSRDRGPGEATPNLSDTLAITYIGMLLLRTPVTVADISKWINAGDLLYYRANKQVPLEMRERLPGRYTSLLEPQEILPAESLHQHILKTLKMLGEVSGLVPPALNTPLVLYRWIRDLALPLEIFAASQRLAKLLNIDAAFQLSASGNANVVLRYPEVRMMALVMITTKLLFPFDDTKRYARSETDLSALAMDWNGWCLAKKKSTAPSEALSYQQAFEFTESDCLAADDDKLDAYLGWVERNVTSEEVRERGQAGRDAAFRRFLFDMFPLENGHVSAQPVSAERSASETDARVGHDQTKMVARRVAERAMNAHRPGALYRRYRDVEELSGPARVLFEEAAKLAGVSLPGMVQAVFLIERRLQKIEESHRKATSTT